MTSPAAENAPAVPMRRIAIASCIGTTIEFYDFLVYGTAAALVFPTVFFPALGASAGTVAAFATFAVAFLARPLGAILFGHFGDRIGRKRTLITTLLLMGISTVLIGLLPGSVTIGIAAPILLIVLRVCQGLAVGGEWAGATLLTAEYAPAKQRGRYGMFPQLGPAIAFSLASATFLLTNLTIGDETTAFVEYGWRVPFIASAVLVAVGLYVRLKIEETPVFMAEQKQKRTGESSAAPLLQVFKHQPKEVLLAAGSLTMLFAFFYMGTTFLTSYVSEDGIGIGLSRPTVLSINIIGGLAMAVTTIWSALYSDRVGRRRVIILSCAAAVVWALVLFPLLDTGSPVAFAIALAVTMGIVGFSYGPFGAAMPEMFQTRYRYTGAGTGYNLAGILGGGASPLLAAQIGASFGSFSIGIFLAAIALLSLLCSWALVESKDRELVTAEPAAGAAAT